MVYSLLLLYLSRPINAIEILKISMTAFTIDLSPIVQLTRIEFQKLCATNPDMRLERSAQGELIVTPPTGGETGGWNSDITTDLNLWNRQVKTGKCFDSSTGFSLPNGGDRSPDAAWIPLKKWQALTPEERQGFLPLCPDFAIELLSPTDAWKQGQKKMEEYMQNGCRLGWLIDPKQKRVAIYRQDKEVEILVSPETLSGEDILPGFVLHIQAIWSGS
jgi:Uma2 family endonuclease